MVSIFDDMTLCTDDEVQKMLPLVSNQRRAQALAFTHVFGRFACLKSYLMLLEILDMGNVKPEFAFGTNGKPFLKDYPDIHFNISHCRNGIAVVVENYPMGVDIESFRPYKEALVRRTMNEDECKKISGSSNPDIEFTTLWTKKEAVVKLNGNSIIDDVRNVLSNNDITLDTHINLEKRYVYSIAKKLK